MNSSQEQNQLNNEPNPIRTQEDLKNNKDHCKNGLDLLKPKNFLKSNPHNELK